MLGKQGRTVNLLKSTDERTLTNAERGVDAEVKVTLGRVMGTVDKHGGVAGPYREPDVGSD